MKATSEVDLEVTAYEVAEGVVLAPQGSSDRTVRNVTLRFTGIVNKNCLRDLKSGDAATTETVENFVMVSPSCRAGRTDGNPGSNSAINIGYANAAGNVNWVGFRIIGGEILHQGTGAGLSLAGPAITCGGGTTPSTVDMTLIGTRVAGGAGAINLSTSSGCPWTITQNGGTLETTLSAGNFPIDARGANATGKYVSLGPVGVANANTTRGTWNVSGSATMTVAGRFMQAPAAAAPTRACNWGDIIPSTTPGSSGQPVNGWYCSNPAGSTWTAF